MFKIILRQHLKSNLELKIKICRVHLLAKICLCVLDRIQTINKSKLKITHKTICNLTCLSIKPNLCQDNLDNISKEVSLMVHVWFCKTQKKPKLQIITNQIMKDIKILPKCTRLAILLELILVDRVISID